MNKFNTFFGLIFLALFVVGQQLSGGLLEVAGSRLVSRVKMKDAAMNAKWGAPRAPLKSREFHLSWIQTDKSKVMEGYYEAVLKATAVSSHGNDIGKMPDYTMAMIEHLNALIAGTGCTLNKPTGTDEWPSGAHMRKFRVMCSQPLAKGQFKGLNDGDYEIDETDFAAKQRELDLYIVQVGNLACDVQLKSPSDACKKSAEFNKKWQYFWQTRKTDWDQIDAQKKAADEAAAKRKAEEARKAKEEADRKAADIAKRQEEVRKAEQAKLEAVARIENRKKSATGNQHCGYLAADDMEQGDCGCFDGEQRVTDNRSWFTCIPSGQNPASPWVVSPAQLKADGTKGLCGIFGSTESGEKLCYCDGQTKKIAKSFGHYSCWDTKGGSVWDPPAAAQWCTRRTRSCWVNPEDTRKAAEAEANRKAEEARKAKEEADRKAVAEAEAKRKADEAARKAKEEADKKAGEDRKAQARKDQLIDIESARYGGGGTIKDVLAQILEARNDVPRSAFVSAEGPGWLVNKIGDPAPNVVKDLVIVYKKDGKFYEQTFIDTDKEVILDIARATDVTSREQERIGREVAAAKAETGFAVVSAQYGKENKKDVLAFIQEARQNNPQSAFVSATGPGWLVNKIGDPAPGVVKDLIVVYKKDNVFYEQRFKDTDSTVLLSTGRSSANTAATQSAKAVEETARKAQEAAQAEEARKAKEAAEAEAKRKAESDRQAKEEADKKAAEEKRKNDDLFARVNAGIQAEKRREDAKKVTGIEIVRAQYAATDDASKDVTALMGTPQGAFVRMGGVGSFSSFGTPASGTEKPLTIVFKKDGKFYEQAFAENVDAIILDSNAATDVTERENQPAGQSETPAAETPATETPAEETPA